MSTFKGFGFRRENSKAYFVIMGKTEGRFADRPDGELPLQKRPINLDRLYARPWGI